MSLNAHVVIAPTETVILLWLFLLLLLFFVLSLVIRLKLITNRLQSLMHVKQHGLVCRDVQHRLQEYILID